MITILPRFRRNRWAEWDGFHHKGIAMHTILLTAAFMVLTAAILAIPRQDAED